jgi:hypothetical protein
LKTVVLFQARDQAKKKLKRSEETEVEEATAPEGVCCLCNQSYGSQDQDRTIVLVNLY